MRRNRHQRKKKEFAKSLGSTNGCLDYKQAALFDKQYPLENPNLGAGVLNKLFGNITMKLKLFWLIQKISLERVYFANGLM